MTAYNLYPTFTDRDGYLGWRKAWAKTYSELSEQVRATKTRARELQRTGEGAKVQKELGYQRAVARKMMTLLDEAKLRRDRILAMHKEIADQGFPIELNAKIVDFSFNKIHNQFSFMPRWLVKVKGKTYYINHLDAEVPFSTREMSSEKTKGMLRFRNVSLVISARGDCQVKRLNENPL